MLDIPVCTMVSGNIIKVDPKVPYESTTQIPVKQSELNDTQPDKSLKKKQSNIATPFRKYLFWESKQTESNLCTRKPKKQFRLLFSR